MAFDSQAVSARAQSRVARTPTCGRWRKSCSTSEISTRCWLLTQISSENTYVSTDHFIFRVSGVFVQPWHQNLPLLPSFPPSLLPSFHLQEIDGKALLLLRSDMMMKYMGLKLGPALKLTFHIDKLKRAWVRPLSRACGLSEDETNQYPPLSSDDGQWLHTHAHTHIWDKLSPLTHVAASPDRSPLERQTLLFFV